MVRKQAEVGVDIPSDGEYGKLGWTSYVGRALNGLQPRKLAPGDPEPINPRTAGRDAKRFEEFYAAYRPVETYQWRLATVRHRACNPAGHGVVGVGVHEPDRLQGSGDQARRRQLQEPRSRAVNVVEAFLPVAAPESARGVRLNRYYASDDAYLAAIADALRTEYRAIVDAGFLIQLDDAFLAHEYDRLLITKSAAEIHKEFAAYIDMLNYALRDIPEEKVRYHVCWGSWNGPHTSDVPLRDHRRSDPAGARAGLQPRSRQPAPRA